MNLCVILVQVLLWGFCVANRFFLEVVEPIDDAAALMEQMITRGTGRNTQQVLRPNEEHEEFTVVLYECYVDLAVSSVSIACDGIADPKKIEEIYKVSNFNAVLDLEVDRGCTFKLDGVYYTGKLLQALVVSVETENFITFVFKRNTENKDYVRAKMHTFLGPLIKHPRAIWVDRFLELLCVNHIGYFYGRDDLLLHLMMSPQVALMQTLTTAAGYDADRSEQRSPNTLRFRSPNPSPSQPETRTSPRPQSPSKSQPHSPSQSPPQSKPPVQTMTERKRSCLSPFKSLSQTLFRCWSRSRSPQKSRPWSLSGLFSGSQAEVAPQPQPQRQSESAHERLSKSEMITAASFLSLKMFDPCGFHRLGCLTIFDAASSCAVNCQFLSMTFQLYGDSSSRQCHNLITGHCRNFMCVCEPQNGGETGNVNMVFCNNALRLYIYQLNFKGVSSNG